MRTTLEYVTRMSASERLQLWAEMMQLANTIQESCDCWWRLDPAMREENTRRCGVVDPLDKLSK